MWIKVNLLLSPLRTCCTQAVEIRCIYLRDNLAIGAKHSIWRDLIFLIYVLLRFLYLHHARSKVHLGWRENLRYPARALSYRRLDTICFDAVGMIVLEKSLVLLELLRHGTFDDRTILREITLGVSTRLLGCVSIICRVAVFRLYHYLAAVCRW